MLGAQTLVFHPAGEVHANRWPAGGGRCFHIEIDHRRLDYALRYAAAVDRPSHHLGGLPVWLASRLYREYRGGEEVSSLVMEGLALQLLGESSRRRSLTADHTPPPWLRRVHDLLHDRFAESLSLRTLAAEGGVHPSHLARAFRRHYGSPVGEFVRRLRVEEACRRLTTSDVPLVAVALDAGFVDQSHFARTFKRLMGMTPAEYRRSVRPGKARPT